MTLIMFAQGFFRAALAVYIVGKVGLCATTDCITAVFTEMITSIKSVSHITSSRQYWTLFADVSNATCVSVPSLWLMILMIYICSVSKPAKPSIIASARIEYTFGHSMTNCLKLTLRQLSSLKYSGIFSCSWLLKRKLHFQFMINLR